MHSDVAFDGSTCMGLWFDEESLLEWVGVVMAVGVCAMVWSV